MTTVTLGRTGITANKNAFGALPIQRVEKKEAIYILQKAFYNGINFFDTARGYTDSEEKLGMAFEHVRGRLFISTKTPSKNVEGFWKDLETSLRTLRTDYIDIYQFHNPDQVYLPGDGTGMYEAMEEAKKQGKIRFIGITNHRETLARQAIESGLYDNLQFPFSYLATDLDINLVKSCKELNVGFLAMKGMSGGLITNSAAAYAFMSQFDNVLPIWGVQRERELDEWIAYNTNPPALDDAMRAVIDADRRELIGNFCRGCGYCMPCPVGIPINSAARMMFMLRRLPYKRFITRSFQADMEKIADCLHCNSCASRCPYKLDTPALLQANLKDYREFVKAHADEVED